MNSPALDEIVNAVLYEGYILYPYRASSKKNRRERFTFGRVYPESSSLAQHGLEPCVMQTECLVEAPDSGASVSVSLRFLQTLAREVGLVEPALDYWTQTEPPPYRVVPELRIGDEIVATWHEALERRVDAPPLNLQAHGPAQLRIPFRFRQAREFETIRDGQQVRGVIVRRQQPMEGVMHLMAQPLGSGLFKVTARVCNQSPFVAGESDSGDTLLLRTMASTHTVLSAHGGEFVSLLDPPERHRPAAESCKNQGTWPVLVGDEQKAERGTMLSSPIILYDYPKIAPQSPGSLFDGTEIDEILTLRILTMTDEEKREMRAIDEHARRLLERTESLPDLSLLGLHGTLRQGDAPLERIGSSEQTGTVTRPPDVSSPTPPLDSVTSQASGTPHGLTEFDDFFGANVRLEGVSVGGVFLRPGGRVRIRPKARADVMDMALNGQTAVVEAVEQDAESRIHLALVLEDDPGRDLGLLRQPGHRFFYGLDEVEPVIPEAK